MLADAAIGSVLYNTLLSRVGASSVIRQPAAVRELDRFRRPRRRLRAGLLQLLCVLAGLALGLLLPRISAGPSVASARVTETLTTIGFGTLGLVSVIFSLLFLVVQWAFGSLSPRLNLFRDDPVVWRTFGVAVGVFVFSVTAALTIANDQQVSVVVPAVEVAAVLLAVALMRVLQVRAFTSIQLAPTLAAIAAEGRSILQDSLFAFRLLADIGLRALSPAVNDPATAVQVLDTMQGVLSPLVTRDLIAANFPAIWRDAQVRDQGRLTSGSASPSNCALPAA